MSQVGIVHPKWCQKFSHCFQRCTASCTSCNTSHWDSECDTWASSGAGAVSSAQNVLRTGLPLQIELTGSNDDSESDPIDIGQAQALLVPIEQVQKEALVSEFYKCWQPSKIFSAPGFGTVKAPIRPKRNRVPYINKIQCISTNFPHEFLDRMVTPTNE